MWEYIGFVLSELYLYLCIIHMTEGFVFDKWHEMVFLINNSVRSHSCCVHVVSKMLSQLKCMIGIWCCTSIWKLCLFYWILYFWCEYGSVFMLYSGSSNWCMVTSDIRMSMLLTVVLSLLDLLTHAINNFYISFIWSPH